MVKAVHRLEGINLVQEIDIRLAVKSIRIQCVLMHPIQLTFFELGIKAQGGFINALINQSKNLGNTQLVQVALQRIGCKRRPCNRSRFLRQF